MNGAIGAAVTIPLRAKKSPCHWSNGFGTETVPKSFQIPNYFTRFPKKIQNLAKFQNFRIKSETLSATAATAGRAATAATVPVAATPAAAAAAWRRGWRMRQENRRRYLRR
jgi:hypothetical protein